ncbi:MAG: hypothetical protein H0T73_15975 [Ardenticatenales bacterium]|nr:hypothetical protein [Ardenticatenales bacterium]
MTHHRRRALLIFGWLLLFVVGPALQVAAQSPGDVPPRPAVPQSDPFFGIVQAIHDPEKAVAAGVRWERLVVWWSAFQPSGPQDWNPGGWMARTQLQEQKARGIEPVGVILNTPGWAGRPGIYAPISPPQNLHLPFDHPENYWGQFLMKLSAEYAGTVDTWILWNEPDMYRESYVNWQGTVEEFAQLQMVGYQAIKRANPNARVILTGTTYWWDHENKRAPYLDRLVTELLKLPGAAQNGAYFDAVSIHQYSNPLNSYTVPVFNRRILESHGLNKPLWLVESNTVPHDDPQHPLPREGLRASMGEQASYMIQSVALARAAGVERYSVYKMRDEGPEYEQYFGLVRNDGSPRPAYVAYQVAAQEMSNVRDAQYFWNGSAAPPTAGQITALLASNSNRTQFVWPGALNGVRMKRGNDRVTVLWNASTVPLAVTIPSSASQATLVTKYGERQALVRQPDNSYQVTLAVATNNTDSRDPQLILVGGDPVILVEPGAANAPDPLPGLANAPVPTPRPTDPANSCSATAAGGATWLAPTGYTVSGPWLDFLRSHGDIDYVGLPRSPVMQDPLNPTQCVQYFQRLILEWHPENPPAYQIQRRLLGMEIISQTSAPPSPPTGPNSKDYWYFPKGDNGLGHAVANFAPDGTPIGFKSYFDRNGREDSFGYPMEPPSLRVGSDGVERWTQLYQAALFEYHPEFDRDGVKPGTTLPWRGWRVQLRLLGDEYLETRPPFILPQPTP